jgi:hypothetical protein
VHADGIQAARSSGKVDGAGELITLRGRQNRGVGIDLRTLKAEGGERLSLGAQCRLGGDYRVDGFGLWVDGHTIRS